MSLSGEWVCPQCGYRLHKRQLHAEGGAVSIDHSAQREVCPNDGVTLLPEEHSESQVEDEL